MRVLMVTNMWPSAERPHWGAFVKSQVSSITDAGVEVVMHEIEGWRRSSEYFRALMALPGIAKRSGAELVHAHYGLSGAAALRVPLPLVVSFCGDDLLGRPDDAGRLSAKSRALVGLSLFAANRAAGIIVKSEEMRRVLPARLEVNVIPNGVNLERFRPRPLIEARAGMGWRAEGGVLLFAANPDEPRKNFRLAREVESRLCAAGRDVRIEVCYGVPQERIALAMAAADVLLLPSFHEGSPNTVKEAMACDLPVVAAPVGDCEERLASCTPSAVVARTPEAFTSATAAVLDAGRRSNGREAIAPLALPAVARRVIAVYERALAKRKVA